MNDSETLKNIEKTLLVILALLVENREVTFGKVDRKKSRNIEVLMAGTGLKASEIAKIVGKNVAAVQKTIQRGRKK
jgi:hypothetical protein